MLVYLKRAADCEKAAYKLNDETLGIYRAIEKERENIITKTERES